LHDALCQFLPERHRNVALKRGRGGVIARVLKTSFKIPEISGRTNLFHFSGHDFNFIGKA